MENMKSFTVLETFKLNSVLKLISQLKSLLQQIGLSQPSINAYLFDIFQSTLNTDRNCKPINIEVSTLEYLTSLLTSDGSAILKKLKKLQAALYIEKYTLTNGPQNSIILRKTSEHANQKKKQKKDKKQKQKEKEKKKNNQKVMNIFSNNDSNSQNIIIQKQKSLKNQPQTNQSNQLDNIFKPTVPLQQSNLLNYNIFGGASGVPSGPMVNIFQRSAQKGSSEIAQTSQDLESSQLDQRDEIRKNLRQIQVFKQFVESQMMMELLSHQNDDIDSVDFTSMGSVMFGRRYA